MWRSRSLVIRSVVSAEVPCYGGTPVGALAPSATPDTTRVRMPVG